MLSDLTNKKKQDEEEDDDDDLLGQNPGVAIVGGQGRFSQRGLSPNLKAFARCSVRDATETINCELQVPISPCEGTSADTESVAAYS